MSTPKRKRGRPKNSKDAQDAPAPAKKRGRPRKNAPTPTPENSSDTPERGRGRSPKSKEPATSSSPALKRRGRPKKAETSKHSMSDGMPHTPAAKSATGSRFSASLEDPLALWQEASDLTKDISAHYSMRENERMLAFAYALTLPKKAVMVEIGVTHGKTGSLLAYVAKRKGFSYIGIDNFTVEGNAKMVRSTFEALDLPINLLDGYSSEVPFSGRIDYLLIDGGHDLFNVREDCERWLPKVKPGGLVLFHEYDRKAERDHPHWFVTHFADLHTKEWTEVDYTPNLMIRRRSFD